MANKITRESAESMWEFLGWYADWETYDDDETGEPTDAGQVGHPVCSWAQAGSDREAEDLAREIADEDVSEEELQAVVSAILYAREARDWAIGVCDLLDDAIAANTRGDHAAAYVALQEAASLEDEYGDHPATQQVADEIEERPGDGHYAVVSSEHLPSPRGCAIARFETRTAAQEYAELVAMDHHYGVEVIEGA